MHALDELDRLEAADPLSTAPQPPDFERVVMARVAELKPRHRSRWTQRLAATAALGIALAVGVPTLLLHSDEGSVDVLAAGARAVAVDDGPTLRLAYDITQVADGAVVFDEHQEVLSDTSTGRFLSIVTLGERRIETAWDGSSFLRWTSTRPDVVTKVDGDPAGRSDAPPDGQVGLLRFMYRTERLRVVSERQTAGGRQWVLRGTIAPGRTMTATLDPETFAPEEIQVTSTHAQGAATVVTTRYTEFSRSTEPIPSGLPGRSRLPVVTSAGG